MRVLLTLAAMVLALLPSFGQSIWPDVNMMIDEPETLMPNHKTEIIFYALPNGNTIEWTAGKRMEDGDDWHFNIQHIAAQTAYLRVLRPNDNIITVYLMAAQKAWNTWDKQHSDIAADTYKAIIHEMVSKYAEFNPTVTINSHSGGGYLIFNYLRRVEEIDPAITRLAFIDSTYGYETETHLDKFVSWLRDSNHSLSVISYEDVTVIYDGKPLVSKAGGTWGRSHQMIEDFSEFFKFRSSVRRLPGKLSEASAKALASESSEFKSGEQPPSEETDAEFYRAKGGRISFKLLRNPDGIIWHTVMVEKNGFIDADLTGTRREGKGYTFWGPRAYAGYIK